VGISATTAVGIPSQYITTLEIVGIRQKFLLSDHGTKTSLVVNAQWQFAEIELGDQNLPFKGVHLYGISIRNQMIEAWWDIMTGGQLGMWKV
jgi:hypothetical protein